MALQTPLKHRTGLQRPSMGLINTASSPTLRASATDINRKASLQALTGQLPVTPNGTMESDLEVGDAVNVPGDMHGVVKFIGSVRGKAGRFVGVELDKRFAARGKNDGDVDGVSYFQTTVPGAGIFLPIHRAERRSSRTGSDTFSATPTTPSYSTLDGKRVNGIDGSAIRSKFSQSVGPGARAPSPTFKPKRPSLPRPESPLRRGPTLAPTTARGFSQSVAGTRPAQTPSKPSLKASTTTRPPVLGSTTTAARPYSRNGSRLGHREEENKNGRNSALGQTSRSPSRQSNAGSASEVQKLKAQLAERDMRLNEQASSLSEMEASVKELSALLPADGGRMDSFGGGGGDEEDNKTVVQLRQMLREKNEKISKLTAEFDAHRADFRSTLDSLEMASTETERVYEDQKRDLLAQLAEMQESGASGQSKEDFEGVAQQLKRLEEFVAELEEGLEESRRGEAEARGEVEFLRGEVERGRSELRREREKAAAALKHASVASSGSSIKDMEQRDDEIRGLKAIIHSLSEGGSSATTKPTSTSSVDGEELKRLKSALDKSQREKESLETELEQIRRDREHTNGTVHARNESELTEKAMPSRPRSNTIKPITPLFEGRMPPSSSANAVPTQRAYCEMCDSPEHDTLECSKLASQPQQHGKETNGGKAAGDADKWCALCEKDGHLAFDCPEEQY